ncbi:MAG: AAA family ATPase [Deltaproteobacteria bacterium]
MAQMTSPEKGCTIAVSGKGGSGKTMLVTIIIKLLTRNKNLHVLAIDADSASSLPSTLGVKATKTVGDIRRQIIEEPQTRAMLENVPIRTVMSDCLEAGDGFHLLAMGRPEGPGCYCSVNDLLRYGIERLSKEFDITIIDCEAGPEQISRRVAQGVDFLIIVSDATVRGIQAAALIKATAEADARMQAAQVGLIINKFKEGSNSIIENARQSGLQILGCIPSDENVTSYDLAGEPLLNLPDSSPSVVAVGEIVAKMDLWRDIGCKGSRGQGAAEPEVAADS